MIMTQEQQPLEQRLLSYRLTLAWTTETHRPKRVVFSFIREDSIGVLDLTQDTAETLDDVAYLVSRIGRRDKKANVVKVEYLHIGSYSTLLNEEDKSEFRKALDSYNTKHDSKLYLDFSE